MYFLQHAPPTYVFQNRNVPLVEHNELCESGLQNGSAVLEVCKRLHDIAFDLRDGGLPVPSLRALGTSFAIQHHCHDLNR